MRFGLIGAGCIGQLRAAALKKIPGVKLVAVTDVDGARAGKLAAPSQARVCRQLEEMLALPEVESVIVSTPPQFHEEAVLAALAARKHVLCEKPLSNSIHSAARMVRAAEDAGRVLTTGFNHRYFANIQFLKQTLASGAIGRLDHVRAFAGHEGLSQFRAPWEYDKAVTGGGALMDVGIHLIDLTAHVLGDVAEVFGVATNKIWNLPGSEDNGFALLRSADGTVATLHATWSEWKGYRFSIEAYGERGMVRAFYAPMMNVLIETSSEGKRRKRRFMFYPMTALREKFSGWQTTVIEAFRAEMVDFAALCRGEDGGVIANGFAGFRAVEIANAIYRSSEKQCVVTLTGPAQLSAREFND